jgi:hypothetical protein
LGKCLKCSREFPNRMMIDGAFRNLQRRKFCLNCSPFGQHNTKNLVAPARSGDTPKLNVLLTGGKSRCPSCQETLDITQFYARRDGTARNTYCKKCANKQTMERQQRLKELAVIYKGGRCAHCGYDRYIGSLEFHHLDPQAKEFALSHSRSTTFEKIRPELDKCILLCSNCHREEHARLKGLLSLPAIRSD